MFVIVATKMENWKCDIWDFKIKDVKNLIEKKVKIDIEIT